MIKQSNVLRATSVVLLVVYLYSVMASSAAYAQESGCEYDPSNPSLESARKSFLALNYKCAEEELNALLALETLTLQDRADAHVLLAEVFYARERGKTQKREEVMEQFVAAFESYRDWRGELNIKSPEFMAMMKEAQDLVDRGAEEEVPVEIAEPAEKGKKKPWYTQWWAIGLGVGIVVGGVVLLTGGGEEEAAPGPLPGFPSPPGK